MSCFSPTQQRQPEIYQIVWNILAQLVFFSETKFNRRVIKMQAYKLPVYV